MPHSFLLRRPCAALAGAVALACLAACGGSAEQAPTRSAQAVFSGLQALQATRVVVQSDSGQSLYTGAIQCEGQQELCALAMPAYVPPSRLTFKFYNAEGQLVSASDIHSTDRDHFAIPHANVMLGAYLFKGLAARHGLERHDLAARLDAFFSKVDSPDGQSDDFEELGMLYTRVRVEKGYDEVQFYSELKARLDAHYVLPPTYFKPPAEDVGQQAVQAGAVGAAAKAASSCPWWASGIGHAADIFGKFIPYVGENVGEAIGKGIGAVVDQSCDEGGKTIDLLNEANRKLDEIQAKLDVMDSKIDALGYDLRSLNNAVYDVMNLTAQINFRRALGDITTSTNTYRNLLGAKYKSLSDYAEKNGGLARLGPDTTAVKLLADIGKQNQAFKTLADETTLRSMGAVLANACADASKMRGDVVAQRGECNLVLAKLTTEFMQAQANLALLMKDEVLMVNTAIQGSSKPETITGRYTSPFSANWDKAQEEINRTLNANLATFNATLGKSFVETMRGAPGVVPYAVGFSAGCLDAKNNLTVSAWYPNETPPYVVTQCYNGGRYVKSKFFYDESQGMGTARYANVLGVVVNTTRTDFTDRSTSWQGAGARGLHYAVIPDALEARGLAVKMNPQSFDVFNGDYPPSWLIEPGATNQYAESCSASHSRCDEEPEKYRYVIKKVDGPADGNAYYTSRIAERSWDISKDNWGRLWGKTPLFATIAYTPDKRAAAGAADMSTTLVWQVELQSNSWGAYHNNWRLRCLTADCTVDGDKLRFSNHARVRTVSLTGPMDGWKTFSIQ